MNRVNGATILVNPFVLYRMIILPSPFKPIIASIKWKVSNNEGIIVARLVIHTIPIRCIIADIVAFEKRW